MKRKSVVGLRHNKSDFKEDIQQNQTQLKKLMSSEIDDKNSFLYDLSPDDQEESGDKKSKSETSDQENTLLPRTQTP